MAYIPGSAAAWMQQEQFVLGGFLRRSWTTKNKPYVCDYPNCDRSYFYLQALRRHGKQKHSDGGVTVISDDIEEIGAQDQEAEQTEPSGQSAREHATVSDGPTQQEQA